MRPALLALAICGCGRIGFGSAGVAVDASDIDAEIDAGDTVLDHVVALPGDGSAAALFGWSVAVSADAATIAIGAYGENSIAGEVVVLVRAGSGWMEQARLVAANRETNDAFGYAIAIAADGNTLVVGAPGEDGGATTVNGPDDNAKADSGAAYVFARTGGVWSQQAYLKASSSDPADNFGASLSISADGNKAVIGALTEDGAGNTMVDAGAAYAYARSGGVWSETQVLRAPNAEANDVYGKAIALSADGLHLAVSAFGEQSGAMGVDGNQADNSQPQAGAVYVLRDQGGTWIDEAYIKASNTDGGDFFGYSVAMSSAGGTLVVSAEGEDGDATGVNGPQEEGAGQAGAVYIFEKKSAWSQVAYVKATNTAADDRFGRSLALSRDGNTLVVGAALEDSAATGIGATGTDDGAPDAGAAYVYRRGPTGVWSPLTYLKASTTAAGGLFGDATAISGQGTTIVVGAPATDGPPVDRGAVYVFD